MWAIASQPGQVRTVTWPMFRVASLRWDGWYPGDGARTPGHRHLTSTIHHIHCHCLTSSIQHHNLSGFGKWKKVLEYQTYIHTLSRLLTYIHTLFRHLNWVLDIKDLRSSLISKQPVKSFKILHDHNQISRRDSTTHWSLLQLISSFLLDI